MTEAGRFLGSFGRALSAFGLYRAGHPTLERALDAAWQDLADLLAAVPQPSYTFLGDTVLFADAPLRERRSGEWVDRLSAAGIERLEFDRTVTQEGLEGLLADLGSRIAGHGGTTDARHMARPGVRFGSVGLRGTVAGGDASTPATPARTATLGLYVREEIDALRWLHAEVQDSNTIPLLEAETIVRSLSVAMHAEQQIVLPLLKLKEFDQYTTTHSLNVSVLAMGLAEYLGLAPREVRVYGVTGLLHDVGKTRIPLEILTKPGRLTDEERAVINRHPADGARLILRSEQNLDLAATVAYEHHIMIDGGGYPLRRFKRPCHLASRLVHVCDVFDALRTNRPYRDAWSQGETIDYLESRAGMEFDPDLVKAFVAMMTKWHAQVAVLTSEHDPIVAPAAA